MVGHRRLPLFVIPVIALAVHVHGSWRFKTCANPEEGARRYIRWFPTIAWGDNATSAQAACKNLTATLRSEPFAKIVDEFSGGYGYSVTPTGITGDPNVPVMQCLHAIQRNFDIKVSPVVGGGECYPGKCPPQLIAANVDLFVQSALATVARDGWDGLSTDFEDKDMYVPASIKSEMEANFSSWYARLSESFETNNATAGLSRWAGCVHNGLGAYSNMTCSEFAHRAPKVHVLAMGTYWDNSPDGFENLLLDSIISTSNTAPGQTNDWQHHLSPALCPTECVGKDTSTQDQLYDRMDLMCALGIEDISMFTFDDVVRLVQDGDLRYTNALNYFKTGAKA